MKKYMKKTGNFVLGVVLFAVIVVLTLTNGVVAILPYLLKTLQPFSTKYGFLITSIATIAALIAETCLFAYFVFLYGIPARKLLSELQQIHIGSGGFNKKLNLTAKGDIGKAALEINRYMDKINHITGQLAEVSQLMHTSSEELSVSTTETNKSLEQIAQSINNISTGAYENTKIVDETKDGIKEILKISESAVEVSKNAVQQALDMKKFADEGSNDVDNVTIYMEEIRSLSKQITDVISELVDSSKKIEDIVQIIRSISDQTNLLALNAAIEAARAGENGKGFTVVSEEIRKLANESGSAAKKIISLVKDNKVKSEKAVEFINNANNRISVGSQTVITVNGHMKNIISGIENIVNQMQEIDEAVEQQLALISEIPYMMEAISTTSGETAAGTQQISASVQEQLSIMEELEATSIKLADMSDNLKKLADNLKN